MNIVLVNLYDSFPNEVYAKGRYTHLALHLASIGHDVLWYSSMFHHGTKTDRNKDSILTTNKRLNIIPFLANRYNKNIGFNRLINDWKLSRLIYNKLEKDHSQKKIDLILVSMGPIFTPSSVIKFSKRHGIKSIIDIQDIYPNAMLALLPKVYQGIAKFFLSPIKKIVSKTVNNADGVSSLSKNRLEQVFELAKLKKTKPGRAIYLNYKGIPEFTLRKSNNKTKVLKIIYIGTIGSFYDFKTVFKAFSEWERQDFSIELHIVGSGPKLEYYKNLANTMILDNIHFYGYLAFESALELIKSCDIGIVPIAKNWPSCIPNKPIDYMGLGLPFFNSVDGELRELVNKYNLGYNYYASDHRSLLSSISKAINDAEKGELNHKGVNGYHLVQERFTIESIMAQFESFIEEVTNV